MGGGHDEELAARKRTREVAEHGVEALDLNGQGCARQPVEDGPGMHPPLMEDELPKVPVGNNEDPLLYQGNCQDNSIGKAVGVVPGNGGDVVAKAQKVVDQAKVRTLVKEDVSTSGAGGTPRALGGLGETSSPVASALA